jgi:hypothetical protein
VDAAGDGPADMREETLVPLPMPRAQIASATRFRSTWIVSSLAALRESGHFDRYLIKLGFDHRDAILETVAGAWLPMTTARAHYDACDLLGLSLEEQLEMGRAVGKRTQASLLSTVVKAARGIGITPWGILPQVPRLWMRGIDGGGGAAVHRLGPKEARAEFVGCELLDVQYFRNAIRGVLLGSSTLFCERGYVHELPQRRAGDVAFRLQWA